jgi:hypothetical protein
VFPFQGGVMIKTIFCIIFFSISAVSCAGADQKEKPIHISDYSSSAAKYMPLAIGNKWVYKVNYLGSVGEIEIVINAQDGEWFVDNKGGKFKIDRKGIRDIDRYILMFPLQREEWVSIIDPKTNEVRKTVGVDENVTVPAGEFEGAVKVHTLVVIPDNKIIHSYHFFVSGVGIVKIETFLEDVKEGKLIRQTTTELMKYDLKEPKS